MADYYCCNREQAMRALLPAPVRAQSVKPKMQQIVTLCANEKLPDELQRLEQSAPRQAEALKRLVQRHRMTVSSLCREARVGRPSLKRLEEKKLIEIREEAVSRDPFSALQYMQTEPLTLTDQQRVAYDQVLVELKAEKPKPTLLFGITGSGKTEVYLQAITVCLEQERQAIVLVPEIALTPQTVERFRGRFGERVSIMHSRLSDGERFEQWCAINRGDVDIVVGTRSAIFAPFHRLGLIIVDEEHEPSYKQGKAPRYQARDVAVVRAKMEKAAVVLGTATPALETYHNAQLGKYGLAVLSERVDDAELPTIAVVDLGAQSAATGQIDFFSPSLRAGIHKALDDCEQVILFLNRRGYSSSLTCMQCDYVAECDDCSCSYTYHRHNQRLICHLCGALRSPPVRCPGCGSEEIRYGGLGTQKLERMTRGAFPDARVMRMDSDTMTGKDSYRKALTSFRAGEVDILIGTQMIAKGLHFPNVTLVGIVFADLSLNLTDFRAGERTFQLIVQVAGRAGRGDLPGRVIVQTFTPFHPVLEAGRKQDYTGFYEHEIEARRQLQLPPTKRLIMIHIRGPQELQAEQVGEQFRQYIGKPLVGTATVSPVYPSAVARLRNQYRFEMMIITDRVVQTSRFLRQALRAYPTPTGVVLQVDVDA
ncbi:MAG TPA: primosomal protein N' [Lentisphaeria bacterium]|nr:primosomal protein N' [Lentisphaeria bacterium]